MLEPPLLASFVCLRMKPECKLFCSACNHNQTGSLPVPSCRFELPLIAQQGWGLMCRCAHLLLKAPGESRHGLCRGQGVQGQLHSRQDRPRRAGIQQERHVHFFIDQRPGQDRYFLTHTLAQVSASTSSGHQRNLTDTRGDTQVAEPSTGIAV